MARVQIEPRDALIIVDVQRDFVTGGALPVPEGEKVVPVLNRYKDKFLEAQASIYATRDWHPQNHSSFRAHGGIWPPHCLKDTEGAEFHDQLELPEGVVQIVSKATEPDKEAYSSFQGTALAESLRRRGVKRVFIGGLATDYCIKHTVLDALKAGFIVFLLEDAIRGVDASPGDSKKAIEEMESAGAINIKLSDIS